jgi:hypothetical protein
MLMTWDKDAVRYGIVTRLTKLHVGELKAKRLVGCSNMATIGSSDKHAGHDDDDGARCGGGTLDRISKSCFDRIIRWRGQ